MQGHVIGAACSKAGKHIGCRYGPDHIRDVLLASSRLRGRIDWRGTVRESHLPLRQGQFEEVSQYCRRLKELVSEVAEQSGLPIIVGGDHSCAIGTWAAIGSRCNGPMGLFWVDAHLDSHTPMTSHSGAIHGMPLAVLLGYGESKLLELLPRRPLISPKHTVVVGARSYEPEEMALLRKLNVMVVDMAALQKDPRNILVQAVKRVSANPSGFGISIDLDAFDPQDAPAVSVPEPGGIRAKDVVKMLNQVSHMSLAKKLKALEITEFNPQFDRGEKTSHLLVDLIQACLH